MTKLQLTIILWWNITITGNSPFSYHFCYIESILVCSVSGPGPFCTLKHWPRAWNTNGPSALDLPAIQHARIPWDAWEHLMPPAPKRSGAKHCLPLTWIYLATHNKFFAYVHSPPFFLTLVSSLQLMCSLEFLGSPASATAGTADRFTSAFNEFTPAASVWMACAAAILSLFLGQILPKGNEKKTGVIATSIRKIWRKTDESCLEKDHAINIWKTHHIMIAWYSTTNWAI